MRSDKKSPSKPEKKSASRAHKRGVVGYNKKTALLEDAITQMNAGKYGRSSAALKELLALDPLNTEARRLFATLHLRLGSLISARTAFESLAREALERQDYWLAESLLREYLTAGPRCVPFLEMLGQVYEQKGDAMAAVTEYGKAIEVLTEDPDPEHPTRATELFAKIRSLAPGSPVAFRFAALFDATSGEMLSSGDPAGEQVRTEQPDPEVPVADVKDDSAAVAPMPWEQLEETVVAEPSLPVENVHMEYLPDVTLACDQRAEDLQTLSPEMQDNATLVQEFSLTTHDQKPLDPAGPPVQESATESTLNLIENVEPSTARTLVEEERLPDPAPVLSDADQMLPELTPNEGQSLPIVEEPAMSHEPVLQEVTEPIAEGPSTPSPMPWDQIQEATLNIPQAVVQTAQDDSVPAATLPEIVATGDTQGSHLETDQTVIPVPSESLFTSMSWEEVLASIGDASESTGTTESKPDSAEAADKTSASLEKHHHDLLAEVSAIAEAYGQHPSDSILPPAHESLTESPVLSTPMPWEQVEEDTVSILRHEPEPEFGTAPEAPVTTREDEAASLSASLDDSRELGPRALAATDVEAVSEPTVQNKLVDETEVIFHQDVEGPGPETSAAPEAKEASASILKPPGIEQAAIPLPLPPETSSVLTEEPTLIVRADVRPDQEAQTQQPQNGIQETHVSAPCTVDRVDESCQATAGTDDTDVTIQEAYQTEAGVMSTASECATPVVAAEPPDEATPEQNNVVSVREDDPIQSSVQELVASSEDATASERASIPAPSEPGEQKSSDDEIRILWEDQSQQPRAEPTQASVLTRWLRRTPVVEEPVTEQSEVMAAPEPSAEGEGTIDQSAISRRAVAASAVEVLFDRSGRSSSIRLQDPAGPRKSHKPHKPLAIRLLNRARMGLLLFLGTCFSTTRSITMSLLSLAAALLALGVIGVGGIGLLWVVMEERPSAAFHNLSAVPQRTLQDASKNGYFMLLGFDGQGNQNPIQLGFDRKFEDSDLERARICLMGADDRSAVREGAFGGVLSNWLKTSDPAVQFRAQSTSIRTWVEQAHISMLRYKQWLKMPFEDWGYGEPLSPNCSLILHAHRLYVADGFAQDIEAGVDRLEIDLNMWRMILSHAKTLRMKMLAADAMTDDMAIMSGLLVRPDIDERFVARLGKMARPLDQVEQSVRWPMQSQFMMATKMLERSLKQSVNDSQPIYASIASLMPLPKQRRFNRYADYYEASSKAASEGRYGTAPKLSAYVRTPADSWIDYLMNPIENIVGMESLPAWETYGMRVIQLDARLRLAGLQAWIRRGPEENDLLTRIAKAGQTLYDPFTGLPMLVNTKKALLYSVGPDGKDNDAHPVLDVVVAIPSIAMAGGQDGKRNSSR